MKSGLFLCLIFQEEEHVNKRNLTNSTTKGNVSPKNHHNHDNSYGYDPLEVTDRSYSFVKKVIKKNCGCKSIAMSSSVSCSSSSRHGNAKVSSGKVDEG